MQNVDYSLKRLLLTGTICSGALILGLGGWAVATNLSGAVVAQGLVSVEGQVKKIQHPVGGIVTKIHIKEGQKVKEGELLFTLDETSHKSTMQLFSKQIDEAKIRIARLEAEEKGLPQPQYSDEIKARTSDVEINKSLKAENDLFFSRVKAIDEQRKQLKERITQVQKEQNGLKSQLEGRKTEVQLINRELKSVEGLERQGYTTLNRLISLKRDLARAQAERDNLASEFDKSNSKIEDAQLNFNRLDQDNRREISTEIRDVKAKLNEVSERFIAAQDVFQRTQIKSPYSGYAHQLSVNSIGGVIQPGESIVNIVPEDGKLLVEAKVAQNDIEQVKLEQKAMLRFTAFNQRTTPELLGQVTHVSADLNKDKDPMTAQLPPHYLVRISLNINEIEKLKGKELHPGMGVDVFIQTESRSALSYLMKPLSDQMSRAFKER